MDWEEIIAYALAFSDSESAGGGLPEGMAMGTFQCTPQNMMNEISIEHGLGAVPTSVVVFLDSTNSTNPNPNYTVMFTLTYNISDGKASKVITYDAGGTAVTDCLDTKTADTDTTIYLPASSSILYFFPHTYRWIAVL